MLTSDSMGMEFIWWVGVVEDRHDPMYLGRCKVRCLGWHTDDKKLMPPGKLPWAFPLMPITSASQTGVGQTPLGPVEGSWVMGFFRDGKEAQEPVMMGTLHGVPEQDVREIYTAQIGFYDARMYDNKIASDMHPFSLDAAKKRIRSLLLGADTRQEDKVPREAEMLTYSGAGVGVIITEQEQISPFPSYHYLNEPTTNRLARGYGDPTSKLLSTDDGSRVESQYSILRRKKNSRNAGQVGVTTGGDFGSTVNVRTLIQFQDFTLTALQAAGDKFKEALVKPIINRFSEPLPPFNAVYPYNHVQQTESGHVFEFDDTPDAERIHLYHRSGSFIEYHPDGTVVTKSVNEAYNIVHSNSYEHIEAHKVETIDKSFQLFVNRDQQSTQGNFSLKIGTGGSYYANVDGGNYYINSARYESNTTSFMVGTKKGSNISGDGSLKLNTTGTMAFDSDGPLTADASQIKIRSEGVVGLSGSGDINLTTSIGAIDISTIGTPFIAGSGIKLHTGLAPIEINAAESAVGATGYINLFLGNTGTLGKIVISPAGIVMQSPTAFAGTFGTFALKSGAPLSISGAGKSLKSCFDDLIDEITKITVPTGSGNSGTPLNTPALNLVKTKIMQCIM